MTDKNTYAIIAVVGMVPPPTERCNVKPESLPKMLRKYADKIQSVSYEGKVDGIWVDLVRGWLSPQETHSVHEGTITECAKMMRWVTPCDCEDCRKP